MHKYYGQANPKIIDYVTRLCKPEDPVLQEIRERANRAGLPSIHVGAFDGLHLEVLVRASGARKAVEIGTLAGYSGVAILRGLPLDGKLYTFEYEPKHAEVARESFRKAGSSERVELHVGPALENLPKIERHGPFDLVFIDADKINYSNYLKWAATHLRIGGMLIADNTFGWDLIADEVIDDPQERQSVEGLRAFNSELARLPSFRFTMLPTSEGMTVAIRIS